MRGSHRENGILTLLVMRIRARVEGRRRGGHRQVRGIGPHPSGMVTNPGALLSCVSRYQDKPLGSCVERGTGVHLTYLEQVPCPFCHRTSSSASTTSSLP